MFIAHITKSENGYIEQSVAEHVRNVAYLSANNLEHLNLYNAAYLAGLLHDLGKCKQEFEQYIVAAANGEETHKGKVNHTFSGVIWLWQKYHQINSTDEQKFACEIIAFSIGSHHGLFNSVSEDGADGFMHRLEYMQDNEMHQIHYEESVEHFFRECTTESEVEDLFEKATEEIHQFICHIMNCCVNEKPIFEKSAEKKFAVGMLVRIILSSLIDADRQDTGMFMNDIVYPDTVKEMSPIWKQQVKYMEEKLNDIIRTDTPINVARTEISEKCRQFAHNRNGIYRLSVPTGAGKTLGSLRYALTHAEKYNKQRIVLITPLLAVIEQNEKVIREYIKDSNLILTHHSNVILDDYTEDEINQYEVLAENWKSSIVISTLVQFLNTLFLGKTTAIRRMAALANSVIVIDEIQSVPGNMISLVNTALNFLAYCCNSTILLCSATQPVFEQTAHPICLCKPCDIVPFDENLWRAFERTRIIDKTSEQGFTYMGLADFALEILEERTSLLIVCNTRKEAYELYSRLHLLENSLDSPFQTFHLSTSMCMKHRLDTMEIIQERMMKQGKEGRIVVVATQLMEAGVDMSFGSVIRVIAGLDNIAQVAGRCNRHGEIQEGGYVYIVNIQNESLKNLQEIRIAQECMREFLYYFKEDGTYFENNLLSEKSISFYYKKLFSNVKKNNKFDFPVPKRNSNIFDMLGANKNYRNSTTGKEFVSCFIQQAFKTAGEEFEVFDQQTTDVIVPYQDAVGIIEDLYSAKAKYDMGYLKNRLEAAKPYTVSLFDYQVEKLKNCMALHLSEEQPFITLLGEYYNEETGIQEEGSF